MISDCWVEVRGWGLQGVGKSPLIKALSAYQHSNMTSKKKDRDCVVFAYVLVHLNVIAAVDGWLYHLLV